MSYYNRRYSQRKTTTQSSKPIIFYDSSRHGYVIKAFFDGAAKNSLMVTCPSAVYLGKEEQAWAIDESDLESAKVVVEAHFGEFEFIDKPEENGNGISIGDASTAGKAALTMFQIGGYQAARKVYSLLIREYHPDVNPDPEANAKAQEITLAWKNLKKELGWN